MELPIIRKARPEDAPGIAQVHVQSWRETYSGSVPESYLASLQVGARQSMWEKALAGTSCSLFVAKAGERIVGFAAFGEAREKSWACPGELYAIYLLKEFQGRGTGRQLFESVRAALDDSSRLPMYLWVLEANPTRSFYESRGGEPIGEKTVEIGGATLREIAYRFASLT